MARFSKAIMCGAAALLLVGAGAYALGSSGSQTISVCVSHKGGALYRASRCARGDSKLTWNRQGPRGVTGPRGRPGSTGAPGVPGTARAYAWIRAGNTPTLDPNRSKGFTAVNHPGGHTGFYCLTLSTGIDASKVAPVVSVAWNSGFAGDSEFAFPLDPSQATGTFVCSGNAVEVITLGGGPPATVTSALDFTIAVP